VQTSIREPDWVNSISFLLGRPVSLSCFQQSYVNEIKYLQVLVHRVVSLFESKFNTLHIL
jgi:hypothetical protein